MNHESKLYDEMMILDVAGDFNYWHVAVVHYHRNTLSHLRYPASWGFAQSKASGMVDYDLRRYRAVISSPRIRNLYECTGDDNPCVRIRLRNPNGIDDFVAQFQAEYEIKDKEIRDDDAIRNNAIEAKKACLEDEDSEGIC